MKKIFVLFLFLFAITVVAQVSPVPMVSPTPMPPAPPDLSWVESLLLIIKGLPGVGPILEVVIKYAVAVSALLTAIVAFLWSMIKVLQPIFVKINFQKLADLLGKLESSQLMYWLKYFSAFNAKKPDPEQPPKV